MKQPLKMKFYISHFCGAILLAFICVQITHAIPTEVSRVHSLIELYGNVVSVESEIKVELESLTNLPNLNQTMTLIEINWRQA